MRVYFTKPPGFFDFWCLWLESKPEDSSVNTMVTAAMLQFKEHKGSVTLKLGELFVTKAYFFLFERSQVRASKARVNKQLLKKKRML